MITLKSFYVSVLVLLKLCLKASAILTCATVQTVQCKRTTSDRDLRLYGVINELASGYGNFCTECKSRKVNETCYNCLKMFREKVRAKCDDVKAYRNHNPLYWPPLSPMAFLICAAVWLQLAKCLFLLNSLAIGYNWLEIVPHFEVILYRICKCRLISES